MQPEQVRKSEESISHNATCKQLIPAQVCFSRVDVVRCMASLRIIIAIVVDRYLVGGRQHEQ